MSVKSRYRSQPVEVKVAIATGISAIVSGIIAGGFALANAEIGKPSSSIPPTAAPSTPSRGTSTSIGASASAPPTCVAKLRITSPAEDSVIAKGADGVSISGTACGLSSDSGWLFDFDTEDGYYYDFGGTVPGPVVQRSQSGIWKFSDSPIGNQGDQNKHYVITLVLAPPECDNYLRTAPQIEGDYKLRSFPPRAGCIIAGKVDVYVTNQ
jgi:hypothetical protein